MNINSPFANIPPVVKNLIIINIIFFAATYLFGGPNGENFIKIFGVYYPFSGNFRIWQVITYMFMHGGLAHIFFNMFALFTFGTSLEYIMGSKRFLNFYLITGLGALVLQFVVQGIEIYTITGSLTEHTGFTIDYFSNRISYDDTIYDSKQASTILQTYVGPMVGASGAIFGLLVAFGLLFPNVELFLLFIPVPIKAKYFIPFYIVIELFLGIAQFSGDTIAHFAHLGGALFGFILIRMWKIRRPGGYL